MLHIRKHNGERHGCWSPALVSWFLIEPRRAAGPLFTLLYGISALSCVPNRGNSFFGVYLPTWHHERLFAVSYSRGCAHIMRDTRRRWRRCVLAIGIGFGRRVVASSSSFRARSRSRGGGGGGGIMKIKWRIKKRGRESDRWAGTLTRTSPSATLGGSEERKGSRQETVTGVPRLGMSVQRDGNTASRWGKEKERESDSSTKRTISDLQDRWIESVFRIFIVLGSEIMLVTFGERNGCATVEWKLSVIVV